ncbi:hypothetical protein [Beijerinckia sp. L45]|uniref:phage neck terminator protein n=1 Tax=Beijerinckia sp. L45 TaxID=1641855 RepID=UPI00131C9F18|nr:hypothetical protein [Beijerinckia sp. L45]
MANDSSVAGFLVPEGTQPPDDAALCALFQPTIVGLTGLAGNLVRRKGQAVPGPQPSRDTTWCAFAVTVTTGDMNPTIVHEGLADGGLGRDLVMRSEELEVSTSFFGPAAIGTANQLRDGFGVAQNRAALRASGIAYVGIDRVTYVPDLENGQFVRRADLVFRARRMAIRVYPIRNLVTFVGEVIADSGDVSGSDAAVTSPITTTAP